jgi:hypothetical protein
MCSRNRFGVPDRFAISSILSARPCPARSMPSATSALSAYFIFCVIMARNPSGGFRSQSKTRQRSLAMGSRAYAIR